MALLLAGLATAAAGIVVPVSAASPASADEPDSSDFNAAFVTSPADADREAQLVQGEDERLIDVRVAGATQFTTGHRQPYRVRSAGLYTLVLPARKAAYTIDDLRQLAPQTFLLQRDGTYLLREHILVDTGATLALSPDRPTTIRMLSDADGFVSIVSRGGRLRLLGSAAAPLTFTSWDETDTSTDTKVTDGRAYILATGQLVVKHTTIQDLGFWSGRTGGLALASTRATQDNLAFSSGQTARTGSSTNSRQTEVLPSGALPAGDDSIDAVIGDLSDVTITGNVFGFFVTGASGVKLRNVTISGSLVDGLVLHRNVTSADIQQVLVQKSRADGVVITRGVEGALLTQVTSSDNGRDGVSITGTALARGPSPSGESVRQFGNNVLTASLVENNGRTGVRIVGGTKDRILGNNISGGQQGLLISAGAAGIVIDANRVADVAGSGVQIRDSTGIEVSGNSVHGAGTGVHVTNAKATVEENTVAGVTLHAVSLIGDVSGTELVSNLLAGRGSSAIDMSRLTGGSDPAMKDNDLSGWQRIITQDGVVSTVEHPLTVIWILVALFVIVGQLALRRRNRRTAVRVPYIDGPAQSTSAAAIEADQSHALQKVAGTSAGAALGWDRTLAATTPRGLDLQEINTGQQSAGPSYQPNQYQPNQYEPVHYEPTQYQPTQYQPTQYEPAQAFGDNVQYTTNARYQDDDDPFPPEPTDRSGRRRARPLQFEVPE